MSAGTVQMRRAQRNFIRLTKFHRLLAFVARRQFGKTYTFANIALLKMMLEVGHSVIFGSAKLNLSREIVRAEAAVLSRAVADAVANTAGNGQFQIADAYSGAIPDQLTADDFAGLFEAQRLEFRFYHDRTAYSRTKVVALRPDTVGETGDLMCDEIGRVGNWREVWEAVEPIVSSNPQFRLLLSTTPPPDDTHFSFDQLAPPPGMEFKVNPDGNIYESAHGVTVLRVDAWDAYAGGVPVYSLRDGKPMSPDAHRQAAMDKDAWDRNYGCRFITGGTAAVNLAALHAAQEEGATRGCRYFHGELPVGWVEACGFKKGVPAVIGVDPATTEKKKSNPTGFCVSQMEGTLHVARAMMRFRKSDGRDARLTILDAVRDLTLSGVPVRCVAIDATNERYWAGETRDALRGICGTLLVVSSERTTMDGASVSVKTKLGCEAVASLEDRAAALPASDAVRQDFRLVKRYKGGFDNEVDAEGNHGDLFDGYKLAYHGHLSGCLELSAEGMAVGTKSRLHEAEHRHRMTDLPDHSGDSIRVETDVWN